MSDYLTRCEAINQKNMYLEHARANRPKKRMHTASFVCDCCERVLPRIIKTKYVENGKTYEICRMCRDELQKEE
jgi:hypothetical protein